MKLFLLLLISAVISFAAINVNTASKEELMGIKGIGEKRANSIIKYRKSHKINTIDDLKNVDGIGAATINNIKKDVKSTNAKKGSSKQKRSKESSKKESKKSSKSSTNKKKVKAEKKTKKSKAEKKRAKAEKKRLKKEKKSKDKSKKEKKSTKKQ